MEGSYLSNAIYGAVCCLVSNLVTPKWENQNDSHTQETPASPDLTRPSLQLRFDRKRADAQGMAAAVTCSGYLPCPVLSPPGSLLAQVCSSPAAVTCWAEFPSLCAGDKPLAGKKNPASRSALVVSLAGPWMWVPAPTSPHSPWGSSAERAGFGQHLNTDSP